MSHDNIIETLDGSHWAITRRGIEQIRTFVSTMDIQSIVHMRENLSATRNRGVVEKQEHEYEHLYDVKGSTATLPIYGKIYPRANFQQALSGGTSVENLRDAVSEIEERDDIDKMVMMIDSPGGNVKGLPSISSMIRDMNTDTVAYAEGTMASGSYWIGSAADKVVVSPNSTVGSIGVYTMLVSKKEKLEEDGIDARVIRSADKKALGNPAEPIDEETVKMVQKQVNALHENFVEEVALNRNITKEQAQVMADGDVETGSDAVEEGFADEVKSLDEVWSEEFDLDTDSDLTETEQMLGHLEERYESLTQRHRAALKQNKELRDRVSELEEQVSAQRDQEIEAVLNQAIEEDQKVAPGRREELRSQLEEDFEGTKSTLDMIEPGAAAPSDSLSADTPEDEEPATEEEAIEALKAEDISVALDRGAAQTYDRFGWTEGEDYVMVDDAIEAARERDLI